MAPQNQCVLLGQAMNQLTSTRHQNESHHSAASRWWVFTGRRTNNNKKQVRMFIMGFCTAVMSYETINTVKVGKFEEEETLMNDFTHHRFLLPIFLCHFPIIYKVKIVRVSTHQFIFKLENRQTFVLTTLPLYNIFVSSILKT
jgi:hypothetical protein